MHRSAHRSSFAAGLLALALGASPLASAATPTTSTDTAPAAAAERIRPWTPRLGRTRPLVAVVGENTGTELVDFVVPYGILADADVADVVALATQPGPMQLRPGLRVLPSQTLAAFDGSTPLGADYVIVPAVTEANVRDPVLLDWLRAQATKGATIVSICDGALVVANAGLFDGHRATGHWATAEQRAHEHPGTRWQHNVRFVADGNVISSAGVSAAIPTALALVEAMGGTDAAATAATRLGASDWSATHDSDQFGLDARIVFTYLGNRFLHGKDRFVIPVADGVDDIALALTLDAYGRTLRSSVSIRGAGDAAVRSSHGLVLLPQEEEVARPVVELSLQEGPSLPALDRSLAEIGQRYGTATKRYVALEMEYAPAYGGVEGRPADPSSPVAQRLTLQSPAASASEPPACEAPSLAEDLNRPCASDSAGHRHGATPLR